MKHAYIHSAKFDWLFIITPPFVCLLTVLLMPSLFHSSNEVAGFSWLLLIVLIDVAHVYSTLFRTYFDKGMTHRFRQLFISVPLFSFVIGVMLYALQPMWFWRVMAYMAVFHFVRQQYGFMRLYGRNDNMPTYKRRIDAIAIYSATLYPLLYWHFSNDRTFNWFLKGDFVLSDIPEMRTILGIIYVIICLVYIISEIHSVIQKKYINVPKNALLLGTALSWLVGIVILNSDITFTFLNVVAHGVPYMALIWIKAQEKAQSNPMNFPSFIRRALTRFGWPLFLMFLILPAIFEEGLWDIFVWHEQIELLFNRDLNFQTPKSVLNLLVPLLSVPQITHYILDGFIWKVSAEKKSI